MMKTTATAKPINFKFNDYLNQGFEFLKNNFGNILLAILFCFIMSIIPFCAPVAIGNFYKYCRKLRKGETASPGDIFNFDDFVPYFILFWIITGILLLFFTPLLFIMPYTATGNQSVVLMLFFMLYIVVMYIGVVIIALKAFYLPALISLGGVKDIQQAWKMSKIMTKNNLLSIFLFSIVVGLLSQLGIILCGIGIFLTLPYMYVTNYFAFEDAMQQIEHDEIKEIGIKNGY